ncbi:MAG: hypothetical protein OXK77_04445 [Gemmatimonadota bacterium]|nr:hypothetical protein [Gemmatimonadota bacterium]
MSRAVQRALSASVPSREPTERSAGFSKVPTAPLAWTRAREPHALRARACAKEPISPSVRAAVTMGPTAPPEKSVASTEPTAPQARAAVTMGPTALLAKAAASKGPTARRAQVGVRAPGALRVRVAV